MKKILIVTGAIYNNNSANSTISKRIINFYSKNYYVDVISISSQSVNFNNSSLNVHDYFLKSINLDFFYFIKKFKTKNLSLFLIFARKFLIFLYRFIFPLSIDFQLYNAYKSAVKNIIDISYEHIILVSSPYEVTAVLFTKFFKLNKNKFSFFQLDRFFNSNLYTLFNKFSPKYFLNLLYEKLVINKLNNHIVLPHLSSFYPKSIVFETPISESELNDYQKNSSFQTSNKRKIIITYAGSFDKKIRNPLRMIELIKKIITIENKVLFKFFLINNLSFFNELKVLFPYNIEINESIDYELLKKEYYKSNFLLFHSNFSKTEIPSKILEYIYIRKPILSFHYGINDPVYDYLKSVDYIVNIDLNSKSINFENIVYQLHKFKNLNNRYINLKYSYKLEDFHNIISNRY